MKKPQPLFPPSADCPECGRKIRVKWSPPRDVAPGLTGLGEMKCLHCGKLHLRAVGPGAAVAEAARVYATLFHATCEHDHGHDHGHDPMHGVSVVPGGDNFAYIKLPG